MVRLGDPDVAIEPAQTVLAHRFGAASRRAIPVGADSSFRATVPGPVRQLYFSIARLPDPAAAQIRFRIHRRSGDEWSTAFEESLPGDSDQWHDRVLDLPDTDEGETLFRFDTSAEGSGAGGFGYWGSVVFTGPPLAAAPRRPNVILICLDTLGAAYLGVSVDGASVSPHIDDLLGRSHTFERAYAQFGNTFVSHSSLFSALHPLHHGRYGGAALPGLDSLVTRLGRSGYLTAAFTENAYVGSVLGFSEGFDWYDDGEVENLDAMLGHAKNTFDRAASWLREVGDRAPFFLFLHTYEVHVPYLPRDAEALAIANARTPGDDRVFPDHDSSKMVVQHNVTGQTLAEADLRRLEALYLGEIHYLDRLVRDLLAELRGLGLERDTLLVLTSDHGDQFGQKGKAGHGYTLHNRVLHVPLAFHWPDKILPRASDAPVQLIDVMPSILELAAVDVPAGLDGRSLAPWILGQQGSPPARPAFAELRVPRQPCPTPEDCEILRDSVQTERFKLVRSRDGRDEELYDLVSDPDEARNVSSSHPEELERHRELLARHLASARTPESAAGAPVMDPETQKRIRALGYLD